MGTARIAAEVPHDARVHAPPGRRVPAVTQDELDAVAAELNGRPRQTLGWWSPSEKFAEAVAMIA
jgi:transposase, IS30 family